MTKSLASQEEASEWMRELGHERSQSSYQKYREQNKLTLCHAGRHLLREVFDVYRDALADYLRHPKRLGHLEIQKKALRELNASRVSLIVSRTVLDNSCLTMPWVALSKVLGAAVWKEWAILQAKKTHSEDFQRISASLEGGASRGYFVRGMNHLLMNLDLDLQKWTQAETASVGNFLLAIMVDSLDIFDTLTVNEPTGVKKQKYLVPSSELTGWLEASTHAIGEQTPIKVPMVEPPRPWVGFFEGGYPNESLTWESPLIVHRSMPLGELKRVVEKKLAESGDGALDLCSEVWQNEDGGGDTQESANGARGHLGSVCDDLPPSREESRSGAPPLPSTSYPDLSPSKGSLGTFRDAVQALNRLQETPFTINRTVWETVKELHSQGKEVGQLISRYEEPLPDKLPWDASEEEVREYKTLAAQTYRLNRDNRVKRIVNARTLGWGERYLDTLFYLPHYFDFRGRMYPQGTILNYQSTDLTRGLVKFGKGSPITDSSQVEALQIALANAWGKDKEKIEDRLSWVGSQESDLKKIYDDPLDATWWQDADEPWQFLSLALDYGQFLYEGYGTESSVMVPMDGTCNGIQVYSLLLRDEVGGLATNCVPDDHPHDIYQEVADEVTRLLLESDHEKASRWLSLCGGGVPRSLVKRSVMTKPYGSTKTAVVRYVMEWYRDDLRAKKVKEGLFGRTCHSGAFFMADMILEAFKHVIHAAVVGMDWIREVARTLAKNQLHLEWDSPLGFPVMQRYTKSTRKMVKTTLHGRIYEANPKLDKKGTLSLRRSMDGAAPNLVHSLDAAACQETIRICAGQGVSSLAMIHDSYGTTAAHAPALSRALRQAWVRVFTPNLLEDFRQQQLSRLPAGVALPEVPEFGSLDVRELLKSRYFFN